MSGEKILAPEIKLKFVMWDVIGNQFSSNEAVPKFVEYVTTFDVHVTVHS